MNSRARFLEIVEKMKGRRVVVYGDIVADRFIYGMPKRISREAPVLILRHFRDDLLLGGGGNAIHNILTLGGVPLPVSVVGNDREGNALIETLEGKGVGCGAVIRLDRFRTPTKTRVLGGMPHSSMQQIVRYDVEDVVALTAEESDRFARLLRDQLAVADGALISDYGYGTVTPALVESLTGRDGSKPVTLDSRYDILKFPGVTAVTPNEEEAASLSGIPLSESEDPASILSAARVIQEALHSEAVLITRGSRGMALYERGAGHVTIIPVYGTDQVADVTGAGDTVIAAFTLALAAGATFDEAARVANYCGGIVVMKMGTATVSNDELHQAVLKDDTLG